MTAKIFHFNAYSDKAERLFKAIPNILMNAKRTPQMARNWNRSEIKRDFNGEIVLEWKPAGYWSDTRTFMHDHNEQQLKTWLAVNLKYAVQNFSLRSIGIEWKRDCSATHDNLENLTVSDIYFLYDFLLDRKSLNKRWSPDFVNEFIGEELDPIMTEMKRVNADEIKKLNDELGEKMRELDNERYTKLREFEKNLNSEYRKKNEDLKLEYNEKIKNVKDSMNLMMIAG